MASRPTWWPAPNTINPETKGPLIQGIFIAFSAFAVTVVGLRFWTRINITRSVGKGWSSVCVCVCVGVGVDVDGC